MKKISILLTLCMGLCSCGASVSTSDSEDFPVKILTYNIEGPSAPKAGSIGYWPNRKEQVIRLIDKGGFDLIGTQETSREMLNDIVKALPKYKWIGSYRSSSSSVNAILYQPERFELQESGHFYYSPTPDIDFTYDPEDPQKKDLNCIWARFRDKKSGIVFYHFNTHLHAYYTEPLRDTLRCRDARLLKQRIASIAGKNFTVCTGDFNCSEAFYSNKTGELVHEAHPGYVELTKGGVLVDTRRLAAIKINEKEGSLPGWLVTGTTSHDRKYDHIFVSSLASGKYGVTRYEVITESAEMTHHGTTTTVTPLKDVKNGDKFTANFSDHRPITATVIFQP